MADKNLIHELGKTVQEMALKHNLESYDFHETITHENVYQEGVSFYRDDFDVFIRQTMEEKSKIEGIENLEELAGYAEKGKRCLITARHLCNFDVPNLYSLIKKAGRKDLFDKIIFIAGRKLNEAKRQILYVTSMFNRVVIIPKTEENEQATKINLAAQRIIKELKTKGNIIWLYPTGTRERDWDESSKKAIPQTYNYLKSFDYVMLMNASGVNYVISKEGIEADLPVKANIQMKFSKVYKADALIKGLSDGCNDKSLLKQHVSDKLMEMIKSI
jgi:hypothetical protein